MASYTLSASGRVARVVLGCARRLARMYASWTLYVGQLVP